jgi:ankyrin repeat protein
MIITKTEDLFEETIKIIKSFNKTKEEVDKFFDTYDLINTKDDNGQTLLHKLCKDGEKEIILLIIEYFKDKGRPFNMFCDIQDKKTWSAIYYAIDISESGWPDIVDLLLKHGSNVNIKDCKSITPLHLAAYKGQDDNVEILLKHKAEPNLKDSIGSKF